MADPTLTVMLADGRVTEHPINGTLLIGRAPDVQVYIDDPSVERRHARIELLDGKVYLTDLGSNTGTFVNGAEISANFRVQLPADASIRFGIVQATFRSAPTPVSPVGPGAAQPVLVTTTAPPRALIPGQTAAVTIELKNIANIVESFRVRVLDLPAQWVAIPVDQINLLPDASSVVRVEITPPRSPEALAGKRQLRIEVEAVTGRAVVRAVEDIEIEAFRDVRMGIRNSGTAQPIAVVRNRGNAPIDLSLSARDSVTQAGLQVTPAQLRVNPGEEGEALVLPGPNGAASTFTITARDLEGNEVGTDTGNYTPPAPVVREAVTPARRDPAPIARKKRRWPIVLLGVLLLGGLAAAGAVFALPLLDSDDDDSGGILRRPTPTEVPTPEPVDEETPDPDDDPTPTRQPTATPTPEFVTDIRELAGEWRNRRAEPGDILRLEITPQSENLAFIDGALQDEDGIIILSTVEAPFEDGVLRVSDGFFLDNSVERLVLAAALQEDGTLLVEFEHCFVDRRGTSCQDTEKNVLVR